MTTVVCLGFAPVLLLVLACIRERQLPSAGRALTVSTAVVGLLLVSLPIVMAWTGMGWVDALLADVALALIYAAYAYVFNLAYDRVFPIAGQG